MRIRGLCVAVVILAACKGGSSSKSGPPSPKPVEKPKDFGSGPGAGPMEVVGSVGRSIDFVAYTEPAPKQAPAPVSLTTSDGVGLAMTRLDARAVVDGPLAFTELRLTFQNPQDRVIEGRFAITLPESAAISRFAMKIDDEWMEAEMVERQAARRAYEDALHRRQDPALLEKEAGNEFRARVFPIPANGTKEIIVSYQEALSDPDAPYVLRLRGLPSIAEVSAKVQVARLDGSALYWDVATLAQSNWTPDRDLAVAGSGATHALGAPGVVALRVSPEIAAAPETFASATVLVDTSASRALGFVDYATSVEALITAMAAAQPGLTVNVVAFDQTVSSIYEGPAAGAAGQIQPALIGRQAFGASRLDAALAWVKEKKATGRVVVITDAVATAGELEAAKLGEAAAALGPAIERLDVVLAGGIRDGATADALARGHLARDGAVLDLDDGSTELARRISLATVSGVAVAVEGALWTWPATLDGMQPGDAAMVYAAMADTTTPAKVAVKLGDARRELTVEPAAAPLVGRAVVAAQIQMMEAQPAPDFEKIVSLSTSYRVLSNSTAMLVLETEADYARFGIDRKSLAGILVVGDRGVEVQSRADAMAWEGGETKQDEAASTTDTKAPEAAIAADDDESGGTGTAMALDEGRMGKRDSDRAEGQYKMKNEELAMPEPKPDPAPPATTSPGNGSGSGSGAAAGSAAQPRQRPPEIVAEPPPPPVEDPVDTDKQGRPRPYTGRMAKVMTLIDDGRASTALGEARRWHTDEPGDVLGLIALGEALEASKDIPTAARVYGSLIDLFPARADLRRFAGERLDRLAEADAGARELAIDTYRRAVEQRPDHLTGHRLLAYALLRAGRAEEAFAALEFGLAQSYPDGRFLEGVRILREDLGLVGAAWKKASPKSAADITTRLAKQEVTLPTTPSTRFVLVWETDANDVDFHIHDAKGGHAWYESKELPSGGDLYADVTTGYGPECFAIQGKPKAAPYSLSIHYYSRGPMGYGMGQLQVLKHDGAGGLTFEARPFVVMNDQAFVELGRAR